jgi:hypothetical protein
MATATKTRKPKYVKYADATPEEQARRDAERKAQVKAAHDQLSAAVETLTTAEGWTAFLSSGAWLRKYSISNVMMIMVQCPEATDVRSFQAWKKAGRNVKKGAKSIKIWAPHQRKQEDAPVDVDSPHVAGEEKPEIGFHLVSVFDVSQTQGREIPLTGSLTPVDTTQKPIEAPAPAELWERLAELVKAEGFSLSLDELGATEGVTNFMARTVKVNEKLPEAEAVLALAHELAHIYMEHDKRGYGQHRELHETEAESVAFIVAKVAGMDASANSVPYIAGWAKDIKTVRESAARVLKTADLIIERIGLAGVEDDTEAPAAELVAA